MALSIRAVPTVRIDGVPFELDDAAKFAQRAKRYSGLTTTPGISPGGALAVQIERSVEQGGGDVTLTDHEKVAASAVLGEWRQSQDHPAAVDVLYRLLAPG